MKSPTFCPANRLAEAGLRRGGGAGTQTRRSRGRGVYPGCGEKALPICQALLHPWKGHRAERSRGIWIKCCPFHAQSAGSWVMSLTAHLQTHHSLNHQKTLASSSSLCQALLRDDDTAVNKTAKNTLAIGGYNNGGQGRINNSTHPTRSLWGLNAIIMHKVLGCWPKEKAQAGIGGRWGHGHSVL